MPACIHIIHAKIEDIFNSPLGPWKGSEPTTAPLSQESVASSKDLSNFLWVRAAFLKGTVAWDFPPPFFFHQKYPPWTLFHILSFFEFAFNFVEHYAAGSQISPLHIAAGSKISPLYDAAGSQVNDCCRNLPAAWCSGESNFPTAFCKKESNLSAALCSRESNLAAAVCSRE